MNVTTEFDTVDLILKSTAETRGVDAFALALIKTEKQLRKLFTYLIFQFPCFSYADIPSLRSTLATNNKVYFDGFEQGINRLIPYPTNELIGNDYQHLRSRLSQAIDYRNKIFHGQLTTDELERDELITLVNDLRKWCEMLANSALARVGYDGFKRNSFQKSADTKISNIYITQIKNIEEYAVFINQHVQRQRMK